MSDLAVWDILIIKGEPRWEVNENMIAPDSWFENGVRKAVVFGGDLMPEKLTLQKFRGHWLVVEDRIPF